MMTWASSQHSRSPIECQRTDCKTARMHTQEAEQEEIMRTKFVHVLLEEQWAKVGRRCVSSVQFFVCRCWLNPACSQNLQRQFRLELGLYLTYLVGFAGWCITGRASCAYPGPPADEAQDFNNLIGLLVATTSILSPRAAHFMLGEALLSRCSVKLSGEIHVLCVAAFLLC